MGIDGIAAGAKQKGIDIVATGDFTHPAYFEEITKKLKPSENGTGFYQHSGIRFVLGTEVSNIYSINRKVKRIHLLVLAPSLEIAAQINEALGKRGKLASDGRPILGMRAEETVELIMGISPDCEVMPAHAWTPWFGVFGSNGGFDSIEECFGDQSKHIHALETGLSSDPAMNWRLSKLDKYSLISNSDAHSQAKMGREANVFEFAEGKINYSELIDILRKKDARRFLETIEFFPEEGKYHYDGHRDCKVSMSPAEAMKHNDICPVCRKPLTIGVMHRVEALADRKEGAKPANAIPFRSIVPLPELIAAVLRKPTTSTKVSELYSKMVPILGNEFSVLLDADISKIESAAGAELAQALQKMRTGKVKMRPGYDGVFGELVLDENKMKEETAARKQGTLSDF
jgi:uncharacterized protein (TIGR00375 family)